MWKKDRNALRKILREAGLEGGEATFACCLVSHMRGKLHMRYYKKRHGGWRSWGAEPSKRGPAPVEFHKAYGTEAQRYYELSVLENLDDQAEFIRRAMEHVVSDKKLLKIARRVLGGYPEQPSLLARVVRMVERQA